MAVLVLHDPVAALAAPDDLDNLIQAQSVAAALREPGREAALFPFDGSPKALARLRALAPEAVFNLAEGSGGQGSEAWKTPELLAGLGIPFTGSKAAAMRLADDKLATKKRLLQCGLPGPPLAAPGLGLCIVKSVHEHASHGLDAASVMAFASEAALARALKERRDRFGGQWFAERFVEGRECNVAVLEGLPGSDGPLVLPPAEILFTEGFGEGPKLVDYKAKWDEDSTECRTTVRSFDFPARDAGLLELLADLAGRTFTAFGLSGYARVDFRVGQDGAPFIIDVNANPCLSPDAGFAAALERAGISYRDGVGRILDAALAERFDD